MTDLLGAGAWVEHQSPGLLPALLPPWVFYLPGCGARARGSGCVCATFVSPLWGTHPAPLHGAQHPGYGILGGTGSSWVWGQPCPHGDRCLRRSGAENPGWGDTGGNFMGKLRHSRGEKGMERGEGMGGDLFSGYLGSFPFLLWEDPAIHPMGLASAVGPAGSPSRAAVPPSIPRPAPSTRRHGLTRAISKMD